MSALPLAPLALPALLLQWFLPQTRFGRMRVLRSRDGPGVRKKVAESIGVRWRVDTIMNTGRKLRALWLASVVLWFVFRPAFGGETKTATIRPDEDSPLPTEFWNVLPEDTVYFNLS